MNAETQIAVTGMGVVCAVGDNVEQLAMSLQKKRCGLKKPVFLETAHNHLPVGEVAHSNSELEAEAGYAGISRTSLLGLSAVRQAVGQAFGNPGEMPQRVAFINGTTVGGMDMAENGFLDYFAGKGCCPPGAHDCGTSTANIARALGRMVYTSTLSTACSSGANAIIAGAEMLKLGLVDAVIAGGTEALSAFHMGGFKSLMIYDNELCRPFDVSRQGLNLGEGAAYIVLERLERAEERGAEILALLAGYANRCDAYHQTASSPAGAGAASAMTEALESASMKPAEIDYINAHGTATPNNDASECEAIRTVFGKLRPAVTSTKTYTGHTTSASGAIESVISIIALREGFIPPNLRLKEPLCADIKLPVRMIRRNINAVMCNSFGFGGNCSTLIFTKP